MELALVAGAVSTTLFAGAHLPMLAKALHTRDVSSYSLPNLLIANVGNLVHTVYVVSLPIGPIWILHGCYLVSMAIMLGLCLLGRARRGGRRPRAYPGPWPNGRRSSRPGGAAARPVTGPVRSST